MIVVMRLFSVVSVAVALVLTGCASNPLVGKWKMDNGGSGTTIMDFRGDGTFTMTMDGVPMREKNGPVVAAEGKWTLKDSDLTLNVEKSPLADEMSKEFAKLGGKADAPAFKPQTTTEKVEFSGDTLSITDKTSSAKQTFTKMK